MTADENANSAMAIGSGGAYAVAAARAYLSTDANMTAEEIATKSLEIAAGICVYTNECAVVETIDPKKDEKDE